MKKTTTIPANQLRDQCLRHCSTLAIPLEPAALDESLSQAEKKNLSHLQFLDLLLGAQANARRERSIARRIREADFAEKNKTLEGFDSVQGRVM
jgi:DNA replication protein DnaC